VCQKKLAMISACTQRNPKTQTAGSPKKNNRQSITKLAQTQKNVTKWKQSLKNRRKEEKKNTHRQPQQSAIMTAVSKTSARLKIVSKTLKIVSKSLKKSRQCLKIGDSKSSKSVIIESTWRQIASKLESK
jgi:hypothetical protein